MVAPIDARPRDLRRAFAYQPPGGDEASRDYPSSELAALDNLNAFLSRTGIAGTATPAGFTQTKPKRKKRNIPSNNKNKNNKVSLF